MSRRRLIPYNQTVKIRELHGWRLSPAEAIEIQKSLAGQVSRQNQAGSPAGSPPDNCPRFIAGADISIKRFQKTATAAVVVLRYPEMSLVDVSVIYDECMFPYIPGLLSFREAPLVLKACEKLSVDFDLLLVDGQGYAHPRRMGLACHLGLLLDRPTIGCAKSRLIGTHEEPPPAAGSRADLVDAGEIIGTALRTKANTKPVYVSIGHKVDLAAAVQWTVACCRGYRIPEPLRLAHLAAGGNLKRPVTGKENP